MSKDFGLSKNEFDAATIVWDYHQLHHLATITEVGIVLGCHDIGVADTAAELYRAERSLCDGGGGAGMIVRILGRCRSEINTDLQRWGEMGQYEGEKRRGAWALDSGGAHYGRTARGTGGRCRRAVNHLRSCRQHCSGTVQKGCH
ncbi:hypothetical protein Pen01_40640 [Phytomonospora endophytica]|nr:hypothetical protein Pen01_40640 [Phytomonospora endophytica]